MLLGDRYLLQDIESGQWYEVSKEYHDNYLKFIEDMSKSITSNSNYKGKQMIFGTGDNIDNTDLKEMFTDPVNYDLLINEELEKCKDSPHYFITHYYNKSFNTLLSEKEFNKMYNDLGNKEGYFGKKRNKF